VGTMRRLVIGTVLLVLVAGLIGACSSDDADMGATGGADDASVEEVEPAALGRPEEGVAYDGAARSGDEGQGSGGSGGGIADSFVETPSIGPRVIKTATVDLEVDRDGLEDATRDSIAIAGRFGGFVLSTSTHNDRSASSQIVLRIPAESFERALTELEDLGEVNAEEISGEDVSQQFVDMEARVRNLEAQETVLLRLMDRSVSVADTIRVQRELQGVQLEIEKLTGRLRYLEDLTDMSTINLSLVEVGAPGHKPPSGVLAKAWQRAVDGALAVVAAVIVGTGVLVPIAIMAAIAFLLLRALRPRLSP
jgi:hypothetical protein